jgi:hypothetical protein
MPVESAVLSEPPIPRHTLEKHAGWDFFSHWTRKSFAVWHAELKHRRDSFINITVMYECFMFEEVIDGTRVQVPALVRRVFKKPFVSV